MKQIKAIILTFLGVALLAGCKSKSNNDSGDGGTVGGTGVPGTEVIVSAKYFRGGWFSPPPNWSHDMTIDFLQYNNGSYKVSAKHADSLCFKSGGLTVAEAQQLITLYTQMILFASTGPKVADAGVEYLEVKTQSGKLTKYHLQNTEVPAGELYVSNPEAMRDFLQDLEGSLATACQ